MKVLWHSNAPWVPTGYGSQVGLFAPRLKEKYEIAVSAFYGLEGARLNWEGIPVFPGLGGDYGASTLADHAIRWFGGPRDGLVLTLLDVWVLDVAMAKGLNMACWCPVDHEPVPPRVTEFLDASGAIPIAMSRFGEEQLEAFDPLYVPHGCDTETFKPHPKDEVRETTGVDKDAFVVGIVAANKGRPSRKSFQQSLEAFRIFRETREDALLYLHTIATPEHNQGEDIPALLEALDMPVGSVMLGNQYKLAYNPLPPHVMAQLYSSFDVLLNPSQGEGFGIPMLEAQACGVPVIATDHSAMTEVVGAGWNVGFDRRWTGQKSWQAVPRVEAILGALEDCYQLNENARQKLSERARAHAKDYDADLVTHNHFLPALEECEARFGKPPVLEPVAA